MLPLQICRDVDADLAEILTGVRPGSAGPVTASAAAAASQFEIRALSQELDTVTCISATLRQLMDASQSSRAVLQFQVDALNELHAAALAELEAFRQQNVESEASAASAALAIHAQCDALIQQLNNVCAEAGMLHDTTLRFSVEATSLQAVAAAAAAAATASKIERNELLYELLTPFNYCSRCKLYAQRCGCWY